MKRLLVVVDMQNDFIDGALGTKEAEAIVPAVLEKIEQYVKAGDDVIFTLDTHDEDYLNTQEGQKLPVPHCIKGTPGWELPEKIGRFPGKRFEKVTFGSLECAKYAAENGYESVELVGLCTDICVISNALLIKAAAPSIPVAVDSRCCAGVSVESHRNALEAMKMCQVEVR